MREGERALCWDLMAGEGDQVYCRTSSSIGFILLVMRLK